MGFLEDFSNKKQCFVYRKMEKTPDQCYDWDYFLGLCPDTMGLVNVLDFWCVQQMRAV